MFMLLFMVELRAVSCVEVGGERLFCGRYFKMS